MLKYNIVLYEFENKFVLSPHNLLWYVELKLFLNDFIEFVKQKQ
jgi:hypothetical protein